MLSNIIIYIDSFSLSFKIDTISIAAAYLQGAATTPRSCPCNGCSNSVLGTRAKSSGLDRWSHCPLSQFLFRILDIYTIPLGASPGEGTGATMSGDEEDQTDGDINGSDESSDGLDDMGFGLPNERERSLMENIRKELKQELKQVCKQNLQPWKR